ncbi:MAG: hypothetical protein ACJ8FY_14700 [Gemmataceae bacterium]
MMRQTWAIYLLAILSFSTTARAVSDDTIDLAKNNPEAKPGPKGSADDQANQQARLKEQFDQFKSQLIRLAQRLEQSPDPSNKEKAKVLRQAISKVNDLGTEIKFEKLVNQLRLAGKDLTLDDLSSIMEKQADLHADIRSILVILLSDNSGRLRKDIESWKLRIAALKRIIGWEDRISAQGYTGKVSSANLAKDQRATTDATKRLLPGSPNDGGDGSEKTVSPRDLPGLAKLQQATEDQIGAAKKYETNQNEDGSRQVDKASSLLKAVLKQWEKILEQLREEEIERVLAALQSQCERLLALQISVRDDTVVLDRAIQEHADKTPARTDDHKALQLADQQTELVQLAQKALQLVQEAGSAVAMAEALTQVRDDMKNVEQRLRQVDAGNLTISIENDIIATLREMIDALKEARRKNGEGKPDDKKPTPPQDPKLVDRLAELKMIRSMQVRVNARTKVYAHEFDGEQVLDIGQIPRAQDQAKIERLQREFKDLATRQQRIMRIANQLHREKD